MKVHHVGYLVSNMNDALREFCRLGYILVQPPEPAPAIGGKMAAFLTSDDAGLIEVIGD